jgi:hypothetical protein
MIRFRVSVPVFSTRNSDSVSMLRKGDQEPAGLRGEIIDALTNLHIDFRDFNDYFCWAIGYVCLMAVRR